MILKCPTLLRNLSLFGCLLLFGTIAQAQMDFNVVTTITGNDTVTEMAVYDRPVLFADKGTGKLNDGSAEILISPDIADRIDGKRIKDMITLYVQMEGKSNGIYVSKKNKNTFVITELQNGRSNTDFYYKFIVQGSK